MLAAHSPQGPATLPGPVLVRMADTQEGDPVVQANVNALFVSGLLIFHWPKQVTRLKPVSKNLFGSNCELKRQRK